VNRIRKELDDPAGLEEAEDACQIVQIWLGDGDPYFTFEPGTFADIKDWGRLMADFARHIALAQKLTGAMDEVEAFELVRAGFEEGVRFQRGNITGNVSGGTTN
jgi:Domain of unknown function (DUF5076)